MGDIQWQTMKTYVQNSFNCSLTEAVWELLCEKHQKDACAPQRSNFHIQTMASTVDHEAFKGQDDMLNMVEEKFGKGK